MQPKKELKVQYIGIFEEIDSFYWPKMHFLKKGQKIWAWSDRTSPPHNSGNVQKKTLLFYWYLPSIAIDPNFQVSKLKTYFWAKLKLKRRLFAPRSNCGTGCMKEDLQERYKFSLWTSEPGRETISTSQKPRNSKYEDICIWMMSRRHLEEITWWHPDSNRPWELWSWRRCTKSKPLQAGFLNITFKFWRSSPSTQPSSSLGQSRPTAGKA